MKTMKIILTLSLVIFFTACKNVENKKDIESTNIVTSNTDSLFNATIAEIRAATIATSTNKNQQYDENIINEIKKHYHKKYGKKGEFKEVITDSTYQLYYRFDGTDNNNDNDFFHDMIYIAKNDSCKDFFSFNPIIYGDLNNDTYRDLVVTVHIEGDGNANWHNEIFVFLNENNKLIFTSVTDSNHLADCEGSFLPKKIENNYLIGNSSCFGPNDNIYSPSVKYLTRAKLDNNKLVFKSKVKL